MYSLISHSQPSLSSRTSAFQPYSPSLRKNSNDLRKNSNDLRKNSYDLRKNSNDLRKNIADDFFSIPSLGFLFLFSHFFPVIFPCSKACGFAPKTLSTSNRV